MSLLAAVPVIGKLLDKVIPDVNARKEAREGLEQMALDGELQQVMGQLEINKTEAAHKSLFVAGWRPFIGWVCGIGLAYNVILSPVLDIWFEVPAVDPGLLYPVMLGMLGLTGARSYEKTKGVAREK